MPATTAAAVAVVVIVVAVAVTAEVVVEPAATRDHDLERTHV
ncbi:hypothetical protein [Pseudonocardia acaciae]|nr:hypothetical protein [Pseudonocardia acaciae]